MKWGSGNGIEKIQRYTKWNVSHFLLKLLCIAFHPAPLKPLSVKVLDLVSSSRHSIYNETLSIVQLAVGSFGGKAATLSTSSCVSFMFNGGCWLAMLKSNSISTCLWCKIVAWLLSKFKN
jgi:hypothetical protein